MQCCLVLTHNAVLPVEALHVYEVSGPFTPDIRLLSFNYGLPTCHE